MTPDPVRRRRFLGLTATGLALGLAGCSGGENESGGGGDTGGDGGDSSGDSGGDSGGGEQDFGGWFDNVSNFDGVVDKTGAGEVTVTVGAEANGGGYGFGPAAIAVDAGTTVVWEWNGEGGSHNVVDKAGDFESELVAEAGHTFSHTFEEAGTTKYECVPHTSMGMRGAVVVE